MASPEASKALEPKFKPGTIVKHPLGMDCMVKQVFDSAKNKETGEVQMLPVVHYELEYLTQSGLQVTQIAEPFIQEA